MLTELSAHQPITLNNENCPYCGIQLHVGNYEKEHVIGRRFIPKGKFNRSWKLILMACTACNRHKADLEDDVSAISMQPDAHERFACEDETLKHEAHRKGIGSMSRRTGRSVDRSTESLYVKVSTMPGVTMTLNLTSPPQVDAARTYDLARLQLHGFFYWLTYDSERRRGGFWTGGFAPILYACRGDWGNAPLKGFMSLTYKWEPRLLGITADGFFKVAIRKHPDVACWSWALEWNNNIRVIGFFGEEAFLAHMVHSLPESQASFLSEEDNVRLRYRVEAPLPESEDNLFS